MLSDRTLKEKDRPNSHLENNMNESLFCAES